MHLLASLEGIAEDFLVWKSNEFVDNQDAQF